MVGTYVALSGIIVRTEARVDSPMADPPKLAVGQEIEVTAVEKIRVSKRGTLSRMQFEGGWVSERLGSGKLLLERKDPAHKFISKPTGVDADEEPVDDDDPAGIGFMKATRKNIVTNADGTKAKIIGELQPGDIVEIMEEDVRKTDGHVCVRIKTGSGEDAWCAKGALVVDETVTEAALWVATHETTVFDEPQHYKVLATCTVRTGPEKDDAKVGEYSKGVLIDVVQEVTNWKGITCFQTITPAKGQRSGGWVKLMTSKGKILLQRVEADAAADKGDDEDEESSEQRDAAAAKISEFLTGFLRGSEPLRKSLLEKHSKAELVSRVCEALGSGVRKL